MALRRTVIHVALLGAAALLVLLPWVAISATQGKAGAGCYGGGMRRVGLCDDCKAGIRQADR